MSGDRPQSMETRKASCKHHETCGHEESNCFGLIGYPHDQGSKAEEEVAAAVDLDEWMTV